MAVTPKQIAEIKAKTEALKRSLGAFKHYKSLAYYPHKMGLQRQPSWNEKEWIDNRVKYGWSIDQTCQPHNISFENKDDMLLIRLSFPNGGLFCKAHQIL